MSLSRNSSYSSNYQQDDNNLEDKSDEDQNEAAIVSNVLLTPIVAGAYSVTDQFMTTTNYDEDEKISDFSNQSCNTSCSSTPAFHSKELANFERTKRLFSKEYESINSSSKQQNHNRSIENRFQEQQNEFTNELENDDELNDEDKQSSSSNDQQQNENRIFKLESQNDQLKNENRLLKIQLKKYIDAISLLQSNDRDAIFKCANYSSSNNSNSINSIEEILSEQIREQQTSLIKNSNFNKQHTTDYKKHIGNEFNAKEYLNYRNSIEYEEKLVKVAEMHREIVDYNDRLHRVLMQKDALIKNLKDQLIEMRGPVSY